MKRPHQIFAVVLFLFAAFIAQQSLDLEYYTKLGPGAGFFPFWLSVLLMVLSAIMFYHATFREAPTMPVDFRGSRTGYLRALAVCLSGVWVVEALDGLGFRITMAVFFLWLLIALGRLKGVRGWAAVIFVTLLGSWGAFWFFGDMLQVPLPIGVFGF